MVLAWGRVWVNLNGENHALSGGEHPYFVVTFTVSGSYKVEFVRVAIRLGLAMV